MNKIQLYQCSYCRQMKPIHTSLRGMVYCFECKHHKPTREQFQAYLDEKSRQTFPDKARVITPGRNKRD